MNLNRVSIVLAGVAALSVAAMAKPPLRNNAPGADHAALTAAANLALDVSASQLQELQFEVDGSRVTTSIVIDGQPRTIELEPHSNRSDTFRVLVQYENGGPLVEVEPPPIRTYKGHVVGWPDSEVRASLDRRGRRHPRQIREPR